ncbi:hypothetical protein [Fictibacillus enclensis]|uniref:hypothetical protein n=1 Tax=Fictibacillus enclensis TaxID=1017270 RepID=UPI0025A113D2|nr:hypothetical protein [Fictibacillus enclensis]
MKKYARTDKKFKGKNNIMSLKKVLNYITEFYTAYLHLVVGALCIYTLGLLFKKFPLVLGTITLIVVPTYLIINYNKKKKMFQAKK